MMVREIDKPMPMPFGLVVKNGSKIFSSSLAGMPRPLSLHRDLDRLRAVAPAR